MYNNISGVILAGGGSKRFNGIIKSKIVLNGRTIISRIIETLNDIFDEIVIVTNSPDEFKKYNTCKILRDEFLDKGPLGGIHSAMKESGKEALFVVGGDMPFLEKELIVKEVDYYNRNKCDILIPQTGQYIEPLHGIYRNNLLNRLEEYLDGENDCAFRLFFRKENVFYMQVEGSENSMRAFTNINSPADIVQAETLLLRQND
jgi:molybdopterin-guanine dinucleotide biosynthesis protein A